MSWRFFAKTLILFEKDLAESGFVAMAGCGRFMRCRTRPVKILLLSANPALGKEALGYRLKESYRNSAVT